jgi:formylmethanofuran dehydrogenase subunit E
VDAIQSLTGCTFGKGNLIYRDYGKNAFTFYRRSDGKAIRIVTRPDGWPPESDERKILFEKVRAGTATDVERKRFQTLHVQRALQVLQVPEEQLFIVREIHGTPPRKARIHESVTCANCGESAMETRIRRFKGQNLCIPCFDEAERR